MTTDGVSHHEQKSETSGGKIRGCSKQGAEETDGRRAHSTAGMMSGRRKRTKLVYTSQLEASERVALEDRTRAVHLSLAKPERQN